MKVEMFSFLRREAGTAEVFIPADNVKILLEQLAELYGGGFRKLLLSEEGTLNQGVNVLVNGRNILFLSGMETELTAEDTVTLIPPAAGG